MARFLFLFFLWLGCTVQAQDLDRLKVLAAEAAGLDTARAFRDEQADYRRQLTRYFLTDREVEEQAARGYYDKKLEVRSQKSEARSQKLEVRSQKLEAGSQNLEVLVEEYFIYLPQNVSASALREAEVRADSMFQEVGSQKSEVGSQKGEVRRFWVRRLQTTAEFEEMAFSLSVGEVSKPFFTPQGLHIIKVLDRCELPPFEEVKGEIAARQAHCYEADKGTQAAVERLKKEYGYAPDKAGISELLSKGSTERTLFTLDGKAYGGKEFARFAAAYPAGTRRQLEAFTAKAVLDYENARIETKHPELRKAMQAHRDSMLIAAITEQVVGVKSRTDEAGLKAYFETHKSDYHWEKPRFRGIVVHCATKKMAKRVKKMLKKADSPLNSPQGGANISPPLGGIEGGFGAEQGLFAEGDNPFVDEQVFKAGKAAPVELFPYTVVHGRKLKGPDDWQEIRSQVVADYRAYLQAAWEDSLLKNR